MHIMVDLETMGTRPNAPIIAIGAVCFTPKEILKKFSVNVDLQSAVEGGGVIAANTVMWWLGQSDAARAGVGHKTTALHPALNRFRVFVDLSVAEYGELEGVWGNGAAFDNVILSESYRRLGQTPPWPFWLDRCFRTTKAEFARVVPPPFEGTKHDALADANHQAQHLIKIWDIIDHE